MRHRFTLYYLTILSAISLCLALTGCSKQPGQSQQQPEQQQQTAAPGTAEQTTPPAQESAGTTAATAPATTPEPAATTKAVTAEKAQAQPSALKQAAPRTATLEAGTPIHVVTIEELSTKFNQDGERFEATLDKSLVSKEWTIAKRGAAVQGIITESDPGGKVKGLASMSIKITGLKLADGREVKIDSSTYTVTAKSSKKKDATKIGIGAGIGAAIGAIAGGGKGAAIGAGVGGAAGTGAVLATKGDPAVVPAETAITFELKSPLKITEQK